MRQVPGQSFFALAMLNIFVLVAGMVALDVIEARPLPTLPYPVAHAGGAAAEAAADTAPVDPARLADMLDDPMSASGLADGLTGFVVDAATGAELFDLDADRASVPASTTKIVTSVAVLDTVGPDHRLRTEVHSGADPGQIVLRGSGDATLTPVADPGTHPRRATLEDLAVRTAQALEAQGIDSVRLGYDDSLFTGPELGPGWRPNYVPEGSTAPVHALLIDSAKVDPGRIAGPRHPDPPRTAAEAFAEQLETAGIGVEGDPEPAAAPAGAEPIAHVDSAPVSALVEFMMLESDNNMAESLARTAAIAMGEEASFAGSAAAMHRVMDRMGVTGVEVKDGSGLSPDNRITPRALVQLLLIAAGEEQPGLDATVTGLPTAHFTGTLDQRYSRHSASADGAGVVRAKTGTLNGVSALAGTVYDMDGNLLVFAFIANAPGAAGPAMDTLAAALARCGCG